MHKYIFHIGDYHSHTSHLEPIEDLAYRRMLDLYYLNEGPLKGSSSEIAKVLGLSGSGLQVDFILGQFFNQDSDGFWRQTRVEIEILHYQGRIKSSSKGGRASGKVRKDAGCEVPLKSTSSAPLPTVNRKPLTNKHKHTRFTRPTVDEIRVYCEQRGNCIDPEEFFAHYETNGWVQGKNKPIKSWKMAVITWEKSRKKKQGGARDVPLMDQLTDRSWAK
jgi:uncharacterized protein YdaU (DUF1376 family)